MAVCLISTRGTLQIRIRFVTQRFDSILEINKPKTFEGKGFESIPAKILWTISNLKPFEREGFIFLCAKIWWGNCPSCPLVPTSPGKRHNKFPPVPYVII